MSVAERQRKTSEHLEFVPNTLAIKNETNYEYFPLKLGPRRGDFVSIEKMPSKISEGYVMYQRKLYRLTLKDFFRNHLNVGKPNFIPEHIAVRSNTVASAISTATDEGQLAGNNLQPSTVNSTGASINEELDLAWKEQIGTLLYLDDPEEGWEFEAIAQP